MCATSSRTCRYEYLWTTDLGQMFTAFLATALIPEGNDAEAAAEAAASGGGEASGAAASAGGGGNAGDSGGAENNSGGNTGDGEEGEQKTRLDLGKFDTAIKQCLDVQSEIAELRAQHDMDFLRINAQPIKQALGTWVTKWMYTYTHYLQSHIMGNLQVRSSSGKDIAS